MKRNTFKALVTNEDGSTLAERNAYAWNSAIRATEAILREYGRTNGFVLSAQGLPSVYQDSDTGRTYKRSWLSPNGSKFSAIVYCPTLAEEQS